MPPVSQLLGLAGTRDVETNVQPHTRAVLVADDRRGDRIWCHFCGPLSSQAARQGGVRAVGSATPTGRFSDYLGFCFQISGKVWLPRYLSSAVRGALCFVLCVCMHACVCVCTPPAPPTHASLPRSPQHTLSPFGWNPDPFP